MFKYLLLAGIAMCVASLQPALCQVRISKQPMQSSRISPLIYGSFMELLNDLVPGMWAEMLNDRSFEGVTKLSDWCFQTGEPSICDQKWDENPGWRIDETKPFNGSRSARLTASDKHDASISQQGLSVRRGMAYSFSGYFKTDQVGAGAEIILKALLPDGKWMTLASKRLPKLNAEWRKQTCKMVSSGTTDRAVFEIRCDGETGLWLDKLSLMPANNVKGWRKDVVEAIRDSRPGIIRWGGSVVDPGGYRWRNGIGDRDLRTPFPNKVWGRIDSSDVGIDEFLQFCEAVKAVPLVCVSFSDGPERAAEMVQYCNGGTGTVWGKKRAESGHPSPYGVKFWQVGNELGDDAYARVCADFAKAIKAEDPSAKVLASFPSRLLLESAGAYLDYVCPHYYTADLASCDRNIRDLAAMIEQTVPAKGVKIAVTEWNSTAGDWGILRGRLATLGCALENARFLNVLHRHCEVVEIANRSNMANSLCSGIIQTNPSGLYKTPSYYAMKLYADHSLPVPLGVTGVPEGLDISACATENNGSVCVFAVNTTREPVRLTLDLSEYGDGIASVRAWAVCDTHDVRQVDVINHWEAPDRVRTVTLPVSGEGVTLPALSVVAVECGR